MRVTFALAVLMTMFLNAARGQEANLSDPDKLRPQLDAALKRILPAQFWGGVAVSKDGTLAYSQGFGASDPPTSNTLVDIGSIAKQFTAATVLKLESEGKLSIEAPVSQWFPVGGMASAVKLRHLLTHTSGMSDEGAIQPLNFPDRDEAVRRAMNSTFHASPGEKWEYCNAGFIVLAAVVEKTTGRTFEEAVREKLFIPAGMRDTGFLDGEGLDKDRCAPRITRMLGGGQRTVTLFAAPDGEPWAWGLRGAGGVLTTFEDLSRWDKALSGTEILSAAIKDKMWTPVLNGYGMGWQVARTGVGTKVSHSGRTRGFSATLSRFIDRGVMIAVVCGEDTDPHPIEQVLVEAIFPAEREETRAQLHVSAIQLNEHKAGQLDAAATWEVGGFAGEFITASLKCDGTLRATLQLAPGTARRVAAELAGLSKGEPGVGRATVMVGLKPYQFSGQDVKLPEGISLRVLPAYRGQSEDGTRILDSRPTLVLMDEKSGFWPLIVRMDPAVAVELIKGLESAGK